MSKLFRHMYTYEGKTVHEEVSIFTGYTVTSVEWEEAGDDTLAPSVPRPKGNGWELVAFSATEKRLFWTWKREEV